MRERREIKKYVCWISEREKVLSFHYEEGYIRKEFESHEDFQDFIMAVSRMYKIQ